jgi:hypothetical protein
MIIIVSFSVGGTSLDVCREGDTASLYNILHDIAWCALLFYFTGGAHEPSFFK